MTSLWKYSKPCSWDAWILKRNEQNSVVVNPTVTYQDVCSSWKRLLFKSLLLGSYNREEMRRLTTRTRSSSKSQHPHKVKNVYGTLMERDWQGKTKVIKELFHYHFIHRKSHMDWRGFKPEPPWWKPSVNGPSHSTADTEVLSLNMPKGTKKKHETSSGRDFNQGPSEHRSVAPWNRGAQILQKSGSHLKIPCARWVTWSKMLAVDPPILDNTTINSPGRHGSRALCTPAVQRDFRWSGWSKGRKLRRSSRQPIYLPKIQ